MAKSKAKASRPADYPPEHDKLREVAEFSQKCGEFLEWLSDDKKLTLARECEWEETDVVATCSVLGYDRHGRKSEEIEKALTKNVRGLLPAREQRDELLAEFFEIDRWKLEDEKRAILDYVRSH